MKKYKIKKIKGRVMFGKLNCLVNWIFVFNYNGDYVISFVSLANRMALM